MEKDEIELEERIAQMAPKEPDILVLYEAIKLLQQCLGLNFDIEVSHKSNIQLNTVLRRRIKQEYGILYFNMGVVNGHYTNSCQFSADRTETIYANFVAAAYGFCQKVPSIRYRGIRAS